MAVDDASNMDILKKNGMECLVNGGWQIEK